MRVLPFFAGIFIMLLSPVLWAGEWSESKEIRQRRSGVVISYRAKLEGNWLIVEASHGKGWHTYTLDNLERAQKKTGKEKPETELSTVIELSGGLKAVGSWYQSKPKELSTPEISWYTWGFENVSRFATQVELIDDETATITINAQACNESQCSMVSDLKLTLETPDELAESDSAVEGMIVSTKKES
jgi:hypothetical protein